MAYSTNDIFNFLKFLTRHNITGGITSGNFFYAWNGEQSAYHTDLLGRWQRMNNGKEGANTGLIENEVIMTQLAPFINPATLTITAGVAPKPTDFAYELALRINDEKVWHINHNQIYYVKQSVIDPPSIQNDSYYVVEYGNNFSFLPTTVTTAQLDYIKKPQDIVWAYTFDSDGRQVYNESGITGLDVIFGGVGYTSPTIAFSAPAAGGVQATGTLTVVGGVITAVVMTNVGNGYKGLTPTFTITGASTTPANFGSPIVSVQPQWLDAQIKEITKRTLTSFGVSFKDADFENFGKSTQNTGN